MFVQMMSKIVALVGVATANGVAVSEPAPEPQDLLNTCQEVETLPGNRKSGLCKAIDFCALKPEEFGQCVEYYSGYEIGKVYAQHRHIVTKRAAEEAKGVSPGTY